MTRRFDRKQLFFITGGVLLGVGAVASLLVGVRHALAFASSDLQWGGSHLLWRHVDPWMQRLHPPVLHPDHFSPPNYLHLLYLVLWPLALLPFATAQEVWCLCSVLCSVGVVMLLTRFYRLTTREGLVVLALLWMSSPFRVVLEVGQISLFELLFFCLVFTARSPVARGLSLGLSAVKYSFAPTTWVFLIWRRKIGALLIALGLCTAGLLGCFLLLNTPLLQLIREPFLVSLNAVNPGVADVMTLFEFVLRGRIGVGYAQTLSYGTAVAAGMVFAVMLGRMRLGKAAELCLLSLASLLFFKHLIYDYVFLVLPLCYVISLRGRQWMRAPIVGGIFLFWFLPAQITHAAAGMTVDARVLLCDCLLLTALLGYTLWLALRVYGSSVSANDATEGLPLSNTPR